MATCIARLCEDKYVEWSTIIDAPVSKILTEREMRLHLRTQGLRELDIQIDARIDRANENQTSWRHRPQSIDKLILANRAGTYETEITLAEIIEQYS